MLLALSLAGVQYLRAVRAVDAGLLPDFDLLPETIGNYTAEVLPVDEVAMAFLQPAAMQSIVYSDEADSAPPVDITMIYGKEWRSIHSPLHCYAAEGFAIGKQEVVSAEVMMAGGARDTIAARRLMAVKDGHEVVVLYALAVPGGTAQSFPEFAWRVATGHGHAGGMIILVRAPIRGNDRELSIKACETVLETCFEPATRFWNGFGSQ